jgi:hypothetical protein
MQVPEGAERAEVAAPAVSPVPVRAARALARVVSPAARELARAARALARVVSPELAAPEPVVRAAVMRRARRRAATEFCAMNS